MRFAFAKENENGKVGKKNRKNYTATILSVRGAQVPADASFMRAVVAILRATLNDTLGVSPRSRILNCLKHSVLITCTDFRNIKKMHFPLSGLSDWSL